MEKFDGAKFLSETGFGEGVGLASNGKFYRRKNKDAARRYRQAVSKIESLRTDGLADHKLHNEFFKKIDSVLGINAEADGASNHAPEFSVK